MNAANDDSGRPVVAELGRPETPDEIAERKAEARTRRRANQTAFNLVLALVASLAVVAFIVLVVVRPQSVEREPVDYQAAARDAQAQFDEPLAAPALPAGWSANRAGPREADDLPTWQVGFLTPSDEYIGLVQALDADDRWVGDQTFEAEATDRFELDGVGWTEYDRRDVNDPGNAAYILVATIERSTVVLAGTATDDEFRTLASAIAAERGAGS